jgi:hypothetical protein
LKKGIVKIFVKDPPIKLENPHPRPDYSKKDKNNKDGRTLFAGFITSINNFRRIILGGFV